MRTNEAVLHEGPSIELVLYSFLIEVIPTLAAAYSWGVFGTRYFRRRVSKAMTVLV